MSPAFSSDNESTKLQKLLSPLSARNSLASDTSGVAGHFACSDTVMGLDLMAVMCDIWGKTIISRAEQTLKTAITYGVEIKIK